MPKGGTKPLNRTERKRLLKADGAQKECVFCGDPAGSPEDIWPDWLMSFMGRLPETKITVEDADGNQKVIDRGRRAALLSTEVCTPCNTGWMGRIETKAAPIMKDLISGKPGVLRMNHRIILADWAVKSAMTNDLVHLPKERFFNKVDRFTLRRAALGSPEWPYPRCTSVWIAYSSGSHPMALPLPCFFVTRTRSKERRIAFNTFTFAAGHLVLQVVTTHAPTEQDCALTFGVPRNRRFDCVTASIFPILPGRRVRYPPSHFRLNADTDFDDFCLRWQSFPWPRGAAKASPLR